MLLLRRRCLGVAAILQRHSQAVGARRDRRKPKRRAQVAERAVETTRGARSEQHVLERCCRGLRGPTERVGMEAEHPPHDGVEEAARGHVEVPPVCGLVRRLVVVRRERRRLLLRHGVGLAERPLPGRGGEARQQLDRRAAVAALSTSTIGRQTVQER